MYEVSLKVVGYHFPWSKRPKKEFQLSRKKANKQEILHYERFIVFGVPLFTCL